MWLKASQPVAALAAARSTTVHTVHIESKMKILFENVLYLCNKSKIVKINVISVVEAKSTTTTAARSTTVHAVHIKLKFLFLFDNVLYLCNKLKIVKINGNEKNLYNVTCVHA